ncbi:disease resistance protein At4g27190-like [Hevea brasiliensis]|uniref:disease resistance protein At4g27190-like n=1 Tax=Hevea brasiliensis TaxID=3981 RepID=UPI0025E0C264|nr:disease resistance protein At4g27190-like [Hevea brasiliensis]
MSHPFTYKSKFETLHHEAEQLMNKRLKLQQSVDEAKRKGEEIYESVDKWLIEAGKAIEEADEFIQGEEQAKKRCFVGLCPDLKTRYLLSKKAEKKALAIDKLVNEGDHDPISFRPRILQIVASSVYHREALNSRVLFLKQVMDALRDPNLNKIGVHGMGGVGKTTLAKEVHRQALEEKLFDEVVMVAVNQTPELRRIQSEVADVLGLTFDVEGIPGRANRLYERLKKEKKVLIILDDIWKQLDLKAVGIPIGDDCKGCKILLTSRDKHVLSQMGTQVVFHLDVLQDEEAWSLFEMTLADAKDSELPPIATEVAKKCAGLPLLLLTVATDLRNRESYAWNDKLKQLSVFDNEEIYAKVHSVLESSYNDLPGNEVKSFFLLCGLLGLSNIPIRSLLKYVMGLSLFKHISTVKEARNKVYTLIDTLKAKCLLIDGDKYGFVKMHDVVRDTALLIASREQHAFIGTRSGSELMKWPNKDSARISLPYCDIEDLPEGWECPKAELLLLFTEVLSLGIPDLFFKGIRNLEVVDFTGMHFVSLPSSLAFLSNIHTLCLHRCQLDDIAIIGDLKQLRVLSFANSYIVELPRQIEELTRLKLLDVSDCSKLKMIPASALSKLSLLEALYMSNSFDQWEADGIRNQGNASLAELEYLSHLMTLEIQILDAKILPKRLFSNGLQSYRILIGDGWDWNGNYETSRMLKLKLKTSIHSEYGVKVLLRETEDLYLDEVRGAENVLYDIDGDGFPQLKHLHVQNNTVIQHIINSTKWAACDAFPILESLILENLMNLEKICHGQLAAGSFNKLGILKVWNCDRLTNLFSLSTARCLLQLRVMEVRFCPNMEAIVVDDEDSNEEVVEFNQLRSLTLDGLPHLRSFRSKMKKAPPGIESRHKQILTADEPAFEEFVSEESSLFNRMVSFPNLEVLLLVSVTCEKIWHDQLSATYSNLKSLTVTRCDNLKYLFSTSIVKSLLQLKTLRIEDCSSLEEIILTEEIIEEEDERVNKIIFPKLDALKLWRLPYLIRFCSGYQIEFQSLRDLDILGCGALMCLVPSVPHTDMMAKQVYTETNHNTEIQSLFNEMVAFSNLENLNLREMNDMKSVWHSQFAADSFCKLKSLKISYCSKLMTVFPSNVLERFQRLEELNVRYCNSLQEIYQLEGFNVIEAFELRKLSIDSLPSLKHVWRKDPQGVFTFQNLKSVEVANCDVLKNLFPASVAEGLLQLEKLSIIECGVEEIVAKPEDVEPAPYYCFKTEEFLPRDTDF